MSETTLDGRVRECARCATVLPGTRDARKRWWCPSCASWGGARTTTTVSSMPLDDDTARSITRAAKKAKDATNLRDALIVNAVRSGGGVREVARAAGMNHTSVLHILKREGAS